MRIVELQLQTVDLDRQRDFYAHVFNRVPMPGPAGELHIQIGASRLIFQQAGRDHAGVYHVAFNIPENQFAAAAAWARQHLTLIYDADGADTVYFSSWDAHALYFADPDGNIIELIARHSLDNASSTAFSGDQLLGISEIGIAADNVLALAAQLQARTGAPAYRGKPDATFTPLGDEHGLLILVPQGRIWYPNTGQPAASLPLTVQVECAAIPFTLSFGPEAKIS
jgi:catechol-2,3-dioxygenase